ncbi:hypothetical protein MMC16_003114 [Acarospora aff. strigata]|nr:hypothetical protein [Acarospora aff. strigata]
MFKSPEQKSKPSILVIGSLNVDIITRTSRIPAPGETLASLSFDTGSGGKGANQAVACARLSRRKGDYLGDVSVCMAGAVGDDMFGQTLQWGLDKDGVDDSGVIVMKGEHTGVATIIVEEQSGENRILFSPNANHSLRPEHFESLPHPSPDVVVLQLEIPLDTVVHLLNIAYANDVHVIFNPAPATLLPNAAYRCTSTLIVNESEVAILTGQESGQFPQPEALSGIADHFRALGVEQVIVTLGSRGVFYSAGPEKYETIPAEKANVVDTTAAGDTFVGAYAVEVARHIGKGESIGEFDMAKAVRFANKAAAKTVERKGAQAAIPWIDEI